MTEKIVKIRTLFSLNLIELHHTKQYFSPNYRKNFSSLHDIGQWFLTFLENYPFWLISKPNYTQIVPSKFFKMTGQTRSENLQLFIK